MEGLEFSVFWIVTALSFFFIWALGMYLVIKGWPERGEAVGLGVALEEREPPKKTLKKPPVQEKETRPQALEEERRLEELEIPIGRDGTVESEIPDFQPEAPEKEEGEEFYRDFGKANIIEFPAEYTSEDSVRGLDGKETGFIKFAKQCYTQIGFRCMDTIVVEKKADHAYKVSLFDLVSDHYTSDEEGYIDFFGRNKEKFAEEIVSLKSNPEFVYKNAKELAATYKNLPQLTVWNKKELFLVFVKSRNEELTHEEMHWLKGFVRDRNLFKVKIFKIIEKRPHKVFQKEAGAERVARKPFTKAEIEFLKKNRGSMSNEELAERLGRTVDSVTHKLSRLGFSRETFEWTQIKEDFLKNNFYGLSYEELADRLGTTAPSVRARCKKLGLKK